MLTMLYYLLLFRCNIWANMRNNNNFPAVCVCVCVTNLLIAPRFSSRDEPFVSWNCGLSSFIAPMLRQNSENEPTKEKTEKIVKIL